MSSYLGFVIGGYLLGSILFAYVLPKLTRHIDIREMSEDGNPGTYNAEPVTLSEPVIPAESVAGEPALAEEEKPAVSPAKNCLQLTSNIDDVLNFAIIHNGAHIVRDICVKNVSEIDLEHLMIRISTGNGLTEDYKLGIEKIKPGEELHFRNLDVQVNADYLVSLTERCTCQLTVGRCSRLNLMKFTA